ncbi:MAG: nuclear transport factor 2 family protein [Pseudomonadota bacterium]
MNDRVELIDRFYRSFQALDAPQMASCYHDEVRFSDPAFPDLRGSAAGAMWAMLCDRAQAFSLTYSDVEADNQRGRAHWEARYVFSATGRSVHNRIDAEFEFRDGRIVRHIDRFDFWRWSRMALGPAGLVLGWTPFLKRKVQSQAAENLERYRAGQT